MTYPQYFKKFCENDVELLRQWIPNDQAEAFLMENAPRLYCPEPSVVLQDILSSKRVTQF